VRTWRAPGSGGLTHVIALFSSADGDVRHAIEDRLARQLHARGLHAEPAYATLPLATVRDLELADGRLRAAGFDGIVAMRAVSTSGPVDTFPSYDAYWGAVWATELPRTVVRLEIDAYSLADRRLLWSAVSKPVDVQDLAQLADAMTQLASRQLAEQGLVRAPAG